MSRQFSDLIVFSLALLAVPATSSDVKIYIYLFYNIDIYTCAEKATNILTCT